MVNYGMQDIIVTLLNSLSVVKNLSEISCHTEDETILIKHALTSLIQNQEMERCSFFLIDQEGYLNNVTGLSISQLNNPQPWLTDSIRFRVGEGIIGTAAATGLTQHCPNCLDDVRVSTLSENQALPGSIISAPVFTLHHQLIGVLNISHPETYFFSDWQIRLIDVYKNMLGQLITNQRLFTQMDLQILARTSALEQLVEDSKRLKEYYASISMQDQLTGLHNRRYFYNQVEIAIANHNRYQNSFCLLLMDIDHFKTINDRFGHGFGDRVLIGVADALKQLVRNGDILVRFGGEEFVIIITNTTCHKSQSFAERIRTIIKALEWQIDDNVVNITMSIGIHCINMECCPTETVLDINQVIYCADLALYKAKERGRDKVVVFDESMRS
jgi:diguanylate cyclase (GGDEF)-like protein